MKSFNRFFQKRKASEEINNLIISLTSYPARIRTVHKTIESLLNQTYHAEKIVLWLAEEQFPNKEKDLPQNLVELTNGTNFEIDWCEDIRSYKKLIPTLRLYPDSVIITCDDDVVYDENCLEVLYDTHLKDPHSIWCHRGHYMLFDKNKELKPYRKWFRCISTHKPSFNILQTGVGAVLYPPKCFYKDILNKELFMELAHDADDIWFWAMVVLNGTKIGVVKNNLASTNSYIKDDKNALYLKNLDYGNDNVLKSMFEHYPTLKQNLSKINPIFMTLKTKSHKVYSVLGLKLKKRIK